MCGIVGLISTQLSRAQIARARDLLVHRGPDDAGLYVGEGAALGARRLSIIDLEGGHQPLSNEDGTTWVAYNGEVLNAPQLRVELEAQGHRFQTRSDTEVIVHAYEQWGVDVCRYLRGMFAFAIWDEMQKRLLLARDRFGIKPLYYTKAATSFAFASEIRSLFVLQPELAPRASAEALWRLFEVGFVPTPLTAFDNIYQLPAGHVLRLEGGEVTVRAYWQPHLAAPGVNQPTDEAKGEAVTQFMDVLCEAVDAWRLSDVPVGCLLSGGVDSSALAALLTEVSGGPIDTFSIGFASALHNESAQAKATAQWLGSHHHELVFTEEAFNFLPHVVQSLETPQCSATSIPIYMLYRACHEAGFKVIMTGEGADELLGGYYWFDGDRRVRRFLSLPKRLRALFAQLPLPVSTAGRRVLARGTADPVERYALWHEVSTFTHRGRLLSQNGMLTPLSEHWQRRYGAALLGHHPLDQFLHLESQTRLVDFINVEVDRMSMAHSVEARPPFLDHRLWEFTLPLPAHFKLSSAGNKLLLREGMAGRLPDAVRYRPKQGLATPHASWWRREQLPRWAEDCLDLAALDETGYFHGATVLRLRQEHQQGRADHSRLLMGVLTTQLWHQKMGVGR